NVDKSVSVTGLTRLAPLWLSPRATSPCQQASARWKTDLNTLDLSLNKTYHVNRYFIANPYFGIRSAWIDQDYKARYGGNFNKSTMIAKNNFWGIGTRAGFNGEFLLGSHIKVFGKAAASILWSKFDIDQTTETTMTYKYSFNNDYYDTAANAETALGISWGTLFSKNNYHIDLSLAYEFHTWFKQNRLRRLLNNTVGGSEEMSQTNLNFEGFALRLQFDF
nr:Lpg1974 family pore-forming outer membrane protein [Chlamydiales bacterium]